MIRRARPTDLDAIERFLSKYAETSMFLRGNLASHGLDDACHPHGTTCWIAQNGAEVCAVGGVTNGGYLMCQAPDAPLAFWDDFRQALVGREIAGMTGVPQQIDALGRALGLDPGDFSLREDLPLFSLTLADHVFDVPPQFALRKPQAQDLPLLERWFKGFHRDTGLKLRDEVTWDQVARGFVEGADGRILMRGDDPVAMTNLNARAGNTVQVGGVFVPPKWRGRGFGSMVVAAQMAALHETGTRTAILFAASEVAAKAYARVGFQRIGSYGLAMLRAPMMVKDKT